MATALKDTGVVAWFASEMQVQVARAEQRRPGARPGADLLLLDVRVFDVDRPHLGVGGGLHGGRRRRRRACTTNYSTGPTIIYFGFGYVPAPTWFKIGAIISVFHIALWFSVGMLWWKLLGWW